MSGETWAIVAATFLGPVFAVAITLWREGRNEIRGRRLHLFRTLMATRRMPISSEHVNAINLVEVDFYGCHKVDMAWREYKSQLDDISKPEDTEWREKKEKLLSKLLFEIAAVLGFNIQAIDIFKGGYAPGGWAHRDARATWALEYVYQLSMGKAVLPLWVYGINPNPPNSDNPPQEEKGELSPK